MQATPRWRVVVRGLMFVVVSGYLVAGTVLNQLFDYKELTGVEAMHLPRWRMFSGAGLRLTQYRFELVEDGARTEVDVYEVLELDVLDQPRGVWGVEGMANVFAIGRRLCRKLGPEVDLRVVARTATKDGWEQVARGKKSLCRSKKGKNRK